MTDHNLTTALKDVFGYDDLRPGQAEPINALLNGQDVFCVMPTGAGKSMIYQLPTLVLAGLTLVVSPLIALMRDQVDALNFVGVDAHALNSTASPEETAAIWNAMRHATGARLVYLAPERLMQPATLEAIKALNITLIAIDEAHCISQWGPAFRPEYEMLTDLKQHFPDTPVVALTASADEVTRRDIVAKLFAGNVNQFVAGFDRPNISLTVAPKVSWKKQLIDFAKGREGQSGIVYCLSRKKTLQAAALLTLNGFSALAYHAGMNKADRDENQQRFVREPGLIMVATIAFGMGIDKPDVRFVFHTDLPASMEAYYQEFGRAGRDGEPADAHMLYGLDDIRMRRMFIENENRSETENRRAHKRLDALIAYCESPTCRRQTLLAYFNDQSEPCGNCDVCKNPVELTPATREGQMVLSAIVRTGQRFGPAHVIDIVVGANTQRLRDLGHDKLPTFGVGSHMHKNQWRTLVRQLVAAGFIHLDIAEYGGLSVTRKGRQLLKGETDFSFRDLPPMAKAAAAVKKRAGVEIIDLTDEDQELFNLLRAKRAELAAAQNVPAYLIFHDKSLKDMAARKPTTPEAFSEVHGVGGAKQDRFGKTFIAVIKKHTENSAA